MRAHTTHRSLRPLLRRVFEGIQAMRGVSSGWRWKVARWRSSKTIPALAKHGTAYLPVSIRVLFDDYLTTVEHFAANLEAERDTGGNELLTRWKQTADALCDPDPSQLRW